MRILEFIHDEDHPEFSNIDIWVKENPGFTTTKIHAYKGFQKPELDSCDLILLHGGTQHIWDKDSDPWLYEEIEFAKEALHSGKPVIGFCLGSQIIADMLGGEVYKAEEREIGWFRVTTRNEYSSHCMLNGLKPAFTTFLWHSDHYRLPQECISLGFTKAAPHQIFVSNALPAVGFQFHPEYTKEIIRYYFEMCPEEFKKESRYAVKTVGFLEELDLMPDTYHLFKQLMKNSVELFKNKFNLLKN